MGVERASVRGESGIYEFVANMLRIQFRNSLVYLSTFIGAFCYELARAERITKVEGKLV